MSKQTKRHFPTLLEMFDLEDKHGATLGSRFRLGLPSSAQTPPTPASKPKRKPGKKTATAAA